MFLSNYHSLWKFDCIKGHGKSQSCRVVGMISIYILSRLSGGGEGRCNFHWAGFPSSPPHCLFLNSRECPAGWPVNRCCHSGMHTNAHMHTIWKSDIMYKCGHVSSKFAVTQQEVGKQYGNRSNSAGSREAATHLYNIKIWMHRLIFNIFYFNKDMHILKRKWPCMCTHKGHYLTLNNSKVLNLQMTHHVNGY